MGEDDDLLRKRLLPLAQQLADLPDGQCVEVVRLVFAERTLAAGMSTVLQSRSFLGIASSEEESQPGSE